MRNVGDIWLLSLLPSALLSEEMLLVLGVWIRELLEDEEQAALSDKRESTIMGASKMPRRRDRDGGGPERFLGVGAVVIA